MAGSKKRTKQQAKNMPTIFSHKNLLKAYLSCRQHKRQTQSAQIFASNYELELHRLAKALQNRSYRPEKLTYFIIQKPKAREIFASEFADRIIHHLLIEQIEPIWEREIFITDSYACRAGKGHHFGARRMAQMVKEFDYYGQFDLYNFFSSIDKEVLLKEIRGVVERANKPRYWKEEINWLVELIILVDPAEGYLYKGRDSLKDLIPDQRSLFCESQTKGLPIGNLSSQFFANVYLHQLDHFVTEKLKMPGYGRYVDDFVILSNDKQQILTARNQIKTFLAEKLKMTLHPKKQQIQACHRGLSFVGYFIKPGGIMVRRNVVKNAKNKLWHLQKDLDSTKICQTLNSYAGHFRQANSYRLRAHLYEHHLSEENKAQIVPRNSYRTFLARPVLTSPPAKLRPKKIKLTPGRVSTKNQKEALAALPKRPGD